MNPRLIAYLRSLGLPRDADQQATDEFFAARRGLEATIANVLNHNENDQQARTNCDLALRALGVDPSDPTIQDIQPEDTQRAEVQPPAADGDALRQFQEAETTRRTQIREIAEMAGASDELVNRMLDDATTTVEQARTQILTDYRQRNRSTVPTDAPAQHNRQSISGYDRNSLSAALQLRSGVSDPTRGWYEYNPQNGQGRFLDRTADPEVGRAVDRGHELASLPLVEVAARCLRMSGIECDPTPRSIANALATRESSVSTLELVGTFTQTFGALMLAGFEEVPDSTIWCSERDNPNFFSVPRTRFGKAGGLTKLASGKSAEHMTFDDKTEDTKVDRYAGQIVIDEQSLINDYFGALNGDTPEIMGAAARRLRPDLVYALLLSNPAMRDGNNLFDNTNHGNLKTTVPLNATNLPTVLTAIAVQQENDVNLNLRGQFLVVPQTLRFTARQLIGSPTVVVAGDTDVVQGSSNVLASEDLVVVSESRLDNGVTDPESGTAQSGSVEDWYVAANSRQHTVEVTYRRGGSRSPEMRSFMLDRGQFGIGFDVVMDIGAKALSWEGLCKADAS